MYYYLDTVLRLWHFTGAEREAREFRRKLVYKTGFCMRYLLRADRPKLSSSPLSYISSFTSKIYASARALRAPISHVGDRGGLFVASDGHSAWLQSELYAAARARNVSVVELGLPPGAVGALAENYALSECDRLVPTRRSSFFRLAAVRSKRPHVRAVWACPATELQARAMASSGATVESCNVMAQCPAPGGRYTYRRRRLGAFGEARRAGAL